MAKKYEYKSVRLCEGMMGVKKSAREQYQQVVHEHVSKGWRLVQTFVLAIAGYGSARYYEIIFEREDTF